MRRFGFLIWILAAAAAPDPGALTVTGTILAPAGTRVELLPLLPDPAPVAEARTDAAGRYALQAPSAGLWRVVVRTPSPLQSPPLPLVEPVEMPPARPGAWAALQAEPPATRSTSEPLVLSGQVVDADGRKPIPGALVWASADPGAFVRTDAEGRFQVAAPGRRRFDLEVLAPGYLLERTLITRPQLVSRKAGTIALPRAGQLRGRVVDPQGRPVTGAAVVAVPENALGGRAFSPSDPVTDRTVSDPQGRFELRRLRPEQGYEIRASRAGAFPTARNATAGREITLVLAPARSARGKVQDPEGRPIAGAEAVARPALRPGADEAGGETGTPAVQSDARGVFSFPELPAAEVELAVRRKGYAPAVLPALRIPPGNGAADLGVVTLRPGITLTGRVIDPRGQAVPEGDVFLLDRPAGPNDMDRALKGREPAATVAADGLFSIADLARGAPVHVVVRTSGYLTTQVRSVRPPTEKPVVIRVEPEAALVGRVVDEAGEPVPGARIDLRWQAFLPEEPDRPVGEPILRDTRADGEGRFEMRGLPAGTAQVSASAPAFVPLEGVEVELPRPAATGELRLVLERGALLQGRVTTAAGEPVAAVRVGVSGASAATNDDGLYWLEGAELGRQEVIFLHPTHGRMAKPFAIQPGVNVLDLTFEPGVEVAGRVVDDTGRPVPGARVELTPEYRFDPRRYRDVAGEDGRFRLSPVVAGRYRLKAGADGFAETERPATLVIEEAVSNLEIALDRGALLSGNILGLPAEDLAQVEVEARGDNGTTVAAWTDGRGRYEVRSLAPGDWTVTARLWDDQRQAKTRVAIRRSDREVTRDLEFEKRLALTVQVLYDEEPLPDARVSVRGQRITAERIAMTDYEGRVRFEDLAPETYRIGLRHARNMIVHNDQVDLQQDRDLVIRLQGATVGGLVVSAADGEPIQNAMLSLRPVEGPEYLVTAGTKSDGRFVVHRVQPNRYRLQANAAGFLQAEQEIQVAAGQTLDDLEIRLQRAQGARVRVRLASGEIPERVHVQVRGTLAQTLTPREGIVELTTLPQGAWTLLVGADGGAVATASLTVPSEEAVAVTLPPAGRLQVRVPALLASDLIGTVRLLSSDGQPFWTLGPGGNTLQQWPLAGGKAVVEGVPAGSWTVQVETPDGQRWQGVAITAGADASVILE